MIRQGAEDPESNIDFVASIKRLMSNKGYVLLLITYGLNVGVFYAMATLLNTVILKHFPVSKTFKDGKFTTKLTLVKAMFSPLKNFIKYFTV